MILYSQKKGTSSKFLNSYKITNLLFEVKMYFITRTFYLVCIPPPSIFTLQPDFDNSVTAPVKYKICHCTFCTKMVVNVALQ